MFISFEGSEGCGKTTQIEYLAKKLESLGKTVVVTREPGGTEIGEHIRGLLKQATKTAPMCAETELLLFAASRAQHVREKIRPHLEKGHIVITDRFSDSTIAYQGAARANPLENILFLNNLSVGNTLPDITILLDLPAEIGLARAHKRSAHTDRIEQESITFFNRVCDEFKKLAKENPNRYLVVDASQSIDTIAAGIFEHCNQRLNNR